MHHLPTAATIRLAALALVAVPLMSTPTFSSAATVSWSYEGVFTTLPTEYVNAGLRIGDRFVGGFTIDTASVDLVASTNRGDYTLLSSFIDVPALGSHWAFDGAVNGAQIVVLNDIGLSFDFFEVYQRDTPLNQVQDPTRLAFFNGRGPTSLFVSDALPTVLPPASAFEFLNLQYTDYAISSVSSAQGRVTTLHTIPEPSSLLLALSGLALLYGRISPASRRVWRKRDRSCWLRGDGG